MKTISFSVEDEIAKGIEKIAAREDKSKSDVLRDMYAAYAQGREFMLWLRAEQRRAKPLLTRLGIATDSELEEYLESRQTYEDRLRQ